MDMYLSAGDKGSTDAFSRVFITGGGGGAGAGLAVRETKVLGLAPRIGLDLITLYWNLLHLSI